MHVLIAVASRYGSTREIAEALAGTLRAAGHVVAVRNAAEVADAALYDAVVLGSAIYNRVLKGYCGDYRDWREIDAWAQGIAQQLASGAAAPSQQSAGSTLKRPSGVEQLVLE